MFKEPKDFWQVCMDSFVNPPSKSIAALALFMALLNRYGSCPHLFLDSAVVRGSLYTFPRAYNFFWLAPAEFPLDSKNPALPNS